ncbi:transaldolase [Acidithiobacillus sp. CV18-2]|nr:transaldolase [Acidithiobacillus sp. CV18-3]MBU2758570.1 transaldolase [Acidithiobacillus sp. BN09-2]MBU2776897.1 transaldolase [Acidithiobacillus sp. CV18-2]MBU2800055.1 transaldolase [Acidithiobacillus sp. VAN18-4]
MTTPSITALRANKQSLWVDNINRSMLDSGTLAHYIQEFGVTGLTSNPTIFDHALHTGDAYDAILQETVHQSLSNEELFFILALHDLSRASRLFQPIHVGTHGGDGWVSLEVSPLLANDTVVTVEQALKLHAQAGLSNLLIKIPGTPAGVSAIAQTIASGVPVNVTLLFSPDHYRLAASAYMTGLESRLERGLDLRVGSVASIFISRWDQAIQSRVPPHLHNRVGIAIARSCYTAYQEVLHSDRWLRLAHAGAQPQKLLWASTGTKDPQASDVLYVESLIAPDTINTVPEKTLIAFSEHGRGEPAMSADGGDPGAVLHALAELGIDVPSLGDQLQRDGANAFVDSWNNLMQTIADKRSTAGRPIASLFKE